MITLAATTPPAETSTLAAVLFYLFASLTAAGALGVVISRNIVRTAVCLLFTLVGVAGLYVLLDSEFLAAVQLVVYVGGTLILIIFGVMLTSKSPFSRFEPTLGEGVLAVVVGGVLFVAMVMAIGSARFAPPQSDPPQPYPVGALGQALLGDYLVPFELVSVVLLVVMIGAAYLARGRRRDDTTVARGASTMSQRARQWN